jgi:ABC-type antimicrobial peptide transport system permease subunit
MTSAIAATYFLNHETTDMLSLPIRGMERRYSGFEEMTKQFNPCVKLFSGQHLAFKPIACDALRRGRHRDRWHDLPVSDVLTMNQLLGKHTLDQSFNATLFTAFAALSLILAAMGLFGVMSYIAAQRTTEIGIRIALGAKREHVMWKMLLDGMRPAVFGLVLGLAASLEAGRLMRDLLYEMKPLDPAVFAAVAATLLAVAAFACMVPAWRASRLDPMQALRTE